MAAVAAQQHARIILDPETRELQAASRVVPVLLWNRHIEGEAGSKDERGKRGRERKGICSTERKGSWERSRHGFVSHTAGWRGVT